MSLFYLLNFEGIFNDLLHPLNIPNILVTLEVFHFDISGNDDNEVHQPNIQLISVTLEVFHFDISGNDDNDLHS